MVWDEFKHYTLQWSSGQTPKHIQKKRTANGEDIRESNTGYTTKEQEPILTESGWKEITGKGREK